jgi:hypothetical protein
VFATNFPTNTQHNIYNDFPYPSSQDSKSLSSVQNGTSDVSGTIATFSNAFFLHFKVGSGVDTGCRYIHMAEYVPYIDDVHTRLRANALLLSVSEYEA